MTTLKSHQIFERIEGTAKDGTKQKFARTSAGKVLINYAGGNGWSGWKVYKNADNLSAYEFFYVYKKILGYKKIES